MNLVSRLTALVTAGVLVLTPSASAATSASGSSSVTANVANTLEATFPGAYTFGSLAAGTTGTTSSEQVATVKSNAAWGLRVAADQADGRMREWTGSAYVAVAPKVLTNPLQWSLTSLGGSAQAASWTSFSNAQTAVVSSQAATGDSGRTVGVTYRQDVSYADPSAAPNSYRILVSYTAEQGF